MVITIPKYRVAEPNTQGLIPYFKDMVTQGKSSLQQSSKGLRPLHFDFIHQSLNFLCELFSLDHHQVDFEMLIHSKIKYEALRLTTDFPKM